MVKIFPFIHAVKVEVKETFIDEAKTVYTECRWRLASDQDILELSVPTMVQHAPKTPQNVQQIKSKSIMTKNELTAQSLNAEAGKEATV